MVAYQLHERWDGTDGTGYPRKRAGQQIHLLARIAGVADEFVAKISHRPYRPAILPHVAMVELLRGVRTGEYDPDVIRGLLHTLSLYPVGSFVELADGRIGKVIRSNGEAYSTPVVSVWHPGESETSEETIDLSSVTDEEVAIKGPLAELPGQREQQESTESDHPKRAAGQQSFFCSGTYVELSDGRPACVIQENPELFTHPVVRAWLREPWLDESEVINLEESEDLFISEPIATPNISVHPVTGAINPKVQLLLFDRSDESEESTA